MNSSSTIYLLFLTIVISAYSTVHLSTKHTGLRLFKNDNSTLKGSYSNLINSDRNSYRTLLSNFKDDTLHKQKPFTVYIDSIDSKTLTLKLIDKNNIVDSLTLKGKYRRGYFKVKRQYHTKFIAGPLLWVLSDHVQYLGLTKDNNLVVIDEGGGYMLLIVFPIFAASGAHSTYEYKKIKQRECKRRLPSFKRSGVLIWICS